MIQKLIQNDTNEPVILQFEPWADLLYLLPGEEVRVAVEATVDQWIEIDKDADGLDVSTWYVYLPESAGFSIVEDGLKIARDEYGSNVIGWSKPLHPASSLRGMITLGRDASDL